MGFGARGKRFTLMTISSLKAGGRLVRRILIAILALSAALALPLSAAHAQTVSAEPDPQLIRQALDGDFVASFRLGEFFAGRGGEGDGERAVEHYRDALSRYEAAVARNDGNTAGLLQRIAAILDDLKRFEEARAVRADRVMRMRAFDPGSDQIAHALNELSGSDRLVGDYESAARNAVAARAAFEAHVADDPWNRLWIGATHFNEAINRLSLKESEAAGAAFEEAARRYRALMEDTDPDIAERASTFLKPTLSNLIDLAAGEDTGRLVSLREEMVALLRRIDPAGSDLALQVYELARLLGQQEKHREKLALLDEARTLREALDGDRGRLASIEWERGLAFFYLDEKANAVEAYKNAIGHYEAIGPSSESSIAALWGNIAGASKDLQDNDTRQVALRHQVEILKRTDPDGAGLAEALEELADVENLLGRKEDAIVALTDEVRIRRALQPGSEDLAYALDTLGRRYNDLGRNAEAVPVFQDAVDTYLLYDSQTKAGAIASRVMLGIAYYQLRKYDEAVAELRGALEWIDAVEQPDKGNTAVTLGNLADLANRLGFFAESESSSLRQIAILREIKPDSAELAWALYTHAFNYYRLSRYEDALEPIREAQAIFRAIHGEDSPDYLEGVRQEGWMLEGAGRYEEALNRHKEGIDRLVAARGTDSVEYANAISGHAWVLRKTNRYVESEAEFAVAAELLEKHLGASNHNTAVGYINLAILRQLLGKNEDAVRLGMRALAVLNLDPKATLDEQRWTYETLSLAFRDLGDRRRAILFGKQAINVQQMLRSYNKDYSQEQMKGFSTEWRRLYENLANMLIEEGRLAEAQAVLAMEKEEELVDFIQRDSSADLRDSTAGYTPREETAQGEIEQLLVKPMAAARALSELSQKKALGGLSADEEETYAALQDSLDKAYESFMDEVDRFLDASGVEETSVQLEVEAINLDYTASIQDELRTFDGRAAMLQVASLGNATHIFLTVPEASVHRTVAVSRVTLSRMVFEALDSIERRSAESTAKLQALYDVLVRPVAEDIRETGATTLMLNLQGFLRYVPFAALHDGEKYLVESYALSVYTPAARTRFEPGVRDATKSAGFGVTAAHQGFSPLPGVAKEIRAIFGGPEGTGALKGTANLDQAFTRDAFQEALKGRPAFVHIASHFKLVPGRETDSFLLLGDGSPLSLADIRKGRGFRFGGVDLLTLSACETARGGGSEGDEVESFGALAQMNGASAVMATLWPVADEATAQIMQSFYRHMIEGGMSKADALRTAQMEAIGHAGETLLAQRGAELLSDTPEPAAASPDSHPYFWSSFVLMGNWL